MKLMRIVLIIITLLGIISIPCNTNDIVRASDISETLDVYDNLSNSDWLLAKFKNIFLSDNPEKNFYEEPSKIQEAILEYMSQNGVFTAGPMEVGIEYNTLLDDTGSLEVYIVQPGYIVVAGIQVHIWDCGQRVGWSWDDDVITSIDKNESWTWLGIGAYGTQTSSDSFMWPDYSSFFKSTDWTMGWAAYYNWDVHLWMQVDAGGGYDVYASVIPLF